MQKNGNICTMKVLETESLGQEARACKTRVDVTKLPSKNLWLSTLPFPGVFPCTFHEGFRDFRVSKVSDTYCQANNVVVVVFVFACGSLTMSEVKRCCVTFGCLHFFLRDLPLPGPCLLLLLRHLSFSHSLLIMVWILGK